MKKILLLGGSAQQVIAIETAKRLGYYTVLCDFLPDNPGQNVADRFYLLSTTDKEAIFEVAEKEHIDGILAYASDPAAPTAAYVAEKLGLSGNPYESVDILCNKDKFRTFLQANGFNAPKSGGYGSVDEVHTDIGRYMLPVIVKPVDSSGSKGATVLHNLDKLDEAVEVAFSFSRSHRIIVEEFIEKKHSYLVGGDVFIYDGKIVQWGLLNCHRDTNVNPLVPVGKSYPVQLEAEDLDAVKDTLQKMVDKLGLKVGAMNVELVVDIHGRVFPIDVGPRSGGNMIPDLLSMVFHTNVIEMSVKVAMGEPLEIIANEGIPYYATHNLHSVTNGTFMGIRYSEKIRPYLIRECIYKTPGDLVEYFDNAAKALGIVFFKFDNQKIAEEILMNINEHVVIDVNNRGGYSI